MSNSQSRQESFLYFAIVGKPQKYPEDGRVMKYINEHKRLFPACAWILHDKDVNISDAYVADRGEGFKINSQLPVLIEDVDPHIHMMFKVCRRMSINTLLKIFVVNGIPELSYAEGIRVPESYVTYMIHDGYGDERDGKFRYSPDELHGDKEILSMLDGYNRNFVQFRQLLDLFYSNNIESLNDYILVFNSYVSDLAPPEAEEYLDQFHKWQYIIIALCKEDKYKNKVFYWTYDESEGVFE